MVTSCIGKLFVRNNLRKSTLNPDEPYFLSFSCFLWLLLLVVAGDRVGNSVATQLKELL